MTSWRIEEAKWQKTSVVWEDLDNERVIQLDWEPNGWNLGSTQGVDITEEQYGAVLDAGPYRESQDVLVAVLKALS